MLRMLTLIIAKNIELQMPRKYNNTKRVNSAKKTNIKIIEATEYLLANVPLSHVTLPEIAKKAEITVQTVMRHMGSRDGCLNTAAEYVANRIDSQRSKTEPGDIDAAISDIISHYESEGRLILNILAQTNNGDSFINSVTERGRIYHRKWVEHCFGPHINISNEETIDALAAATDIYVYKIIRLDMGRSLNVTKSVINRLVRGIIQE